MFFFSIFRDEAWAESMKMGSFMSVAAGSAEPLRFLEMSYKGGDKVNNKITYQIPLHTYRLYDFLLLIVHKYI